MRFIDLFKGKLRLALAFALTAGFLFAPAAAAPLADNKIMRIGLIYGDGAVDSFPTTSETGFFIGYTLKGKEGRDFVPLFFAADKKLAPARDVNLAKNAVGRLYYNDKNIVVGAFNMRFPDAFASAAEALAFIAALPEALAAVAFPAYDNGAFSVKCGNFTSEAAALEFAAAYPDRALTVSPPEKSALAVINPETEKIVFEFLSSDFDLALTAAKSSEPPKNLTSDETGFSLSPASNTYPGALVYRTAASGLVEVINLIALEDYIKGVLPSEIYTAWPKEALKAFSLVVRSFSVNGMNRHTSAGYDLCNDIHCQKFLGLKYSTAESNAAVDETRGMVITYEGKIIEAYYHAISGGATENHNDAWGGDSLKIPYLASVQLPFERYSEYTNGVWKRRVTPAELYEYLINTSSYSARFKANLTSPPLNIKTTQRSVPSGYIKQVAVSDAAGNTALVTDSDAVRIAFARYANSANMEIYTAFNRAVNALGMTEIETKSLYTISRNGVTENGVHAGEIAVLSSAGLTTYTTLDFSFVFEGKGWGHGVGLSQYAMYDLAKDGYTFDEIIKVFYTGVEIGY